MHDQSESEDNLKQKYVSTKKSTDKLDVSRNPETSEPSTSTLESHTTSSPQVSRQMDPQQSRIIIINRFPEVSEKIESTKQQTFKLPTDSEGRAPCPQQEMVGDDLTKKSEVRIACECEPNVAGAAVPAVQSFIPIEHQPSLSGCRRSNCFLPPTSLKGNDNVNPQCECETAHLKSKTKAKPVSKIAHLIRDAEKDKKTKTSQLENPKSVTRKPSLIPKLTKVNSNSGRLDKNETEKRDFVPPCTKSDLQKPPSTNTAKSKSASNCDAPPYVNTISSRMLGLQERLKATTSMLRQKMQSDKSKEALSSEEHSFDLTIEEEIRKDPSVFSTTPKTVDDLYKSIFSLKDVASALSENNSLKGQSKYIEKLFLNISEIKLIADKLFMSESQPKLDSEGIVADKEKSPKSPSSTNAQANKDNKIYIKFMHARDRKPEGKKRMKDFSPDGGDEARNDVSLNSKVEADSETRLEKNQNESKVKEADSMDGVFIPSCEPPKNMEDDDETNGLDITITFPECSHLYSTCSESHLSVCLSDISAEALKKLKRCPKDFTLRMDFVEGKVHFQSGRGPANNFQIGPDLKFCENVIDTKKSDVISIKPSTECSFGSQLIPVDSPKQIKSFKSLKSTDSELFNVVSLPFLYTNPYLATSHKSCITFRNEQIMSMAILAKHIFKSMPQIPSLTNIFEDKVMESPSKAGSRETTKESIESEKMD